MTGIDDLRSTLTHRADEVVVSATDTVTRTAAVHERVATVRRRRGGGRARRGGWRRGAALRLGRA